MSLSSISISSKIFAIIALLTAACIALVAIALIEVSALNRTIHEMDRSAHEIQLTGRMSEEVLKLNGADYRLAADPSGLDAFKAVLDQAGADFQHELQEAKSYASGEEIATLAETERAFQSYMASLQKTAALADKDGTPQLEMAPTREEATDAGSP